MNGIVVNGFARTSTDSGNTVPGFLDLASDIAFGILLISFPTSQAALERNAVRTRLATSRVPATTGREERLLGRGGGREAWRIRRRSIDRTAWRDAPAGAGRARP